MLISIIIPVLNEGQSIGRTLKVLKAHPGVEVIVVDGNSSDDTVSIAKGSGAIVVQSERGRAVQMNKGAQAAKGNILLFLHADTILPSDFYTTARDALSEKNSFIAGRFDIAFDNNLPVYRMISFFINARSRITGIFSGDQAVFVKKEVWQNTGGFSRIPIMEDIEFANRIKRKGSIFCSSKKVITSARRWEQNGVIKTILLMWALRISFYAGVSPERLAGFYINTR